jgi:hypothetical protein
MHKTPNSLPQYLIFDIFHNDVDEIVVISRPNNLVIQVKGQLLMKKSCGHRHIDIHHSFFGPFQSIVEISINGATYMIPMNKYPSFKNEILMSTLVKNEDAYICTWIEYHKKMGVNRFIIYDNCDVIDCSSNLSKVLHDYISKNEVVLIRWNYNYFEGGQQGQQNHCIYAFQLSNYIGLFDVDEYLNPQKDETVVQLLQQLEKNISREKIGCFRFLNKFFYNPTNIQYDSSSFLELNECSSITLNGNEKCFVIPNNVNAFSVHCITNGKPHYKVDPTIAYFNHYYFLNKENRGQITTGIFDNSIKRFLGKEHL